MRELRSGVVCGGLAYCVWGVSPVYYHALIGVPAVGILCHRVVWSVVLLAAIVSVRGAWGEVRRLAGDGRTALLLLASTVFLAANWLIFIYLITSGRTLQSSLGYFISPLLSAAIGVALLRERLRSGQWVAMGVAAVGVAVYAAGRGEAPGLGLLLAVAFSMYGLCRKASKTAAVPGLMLETLALAPAALVYLAVWGRGEMAGARAWLLPGAGVITAVPLLLFAAAARRLPLTLLGLLQYVTPTLQFVCGCVVFGEVMRAGQVAGFVVIWIALGVYTAEGWVLGRRRMAQAEVVVEM